MAMQMRTFPVVNSRVCLHTGLFFLPVLIYIFSFSSGDYFLPFALIAVASSVGLCSPSQEKKAALHVLGGFLFTVALFMVMMLTMTDLTIAPPSHWFSEH